MSLLTSLLKFRVARVTGDGKSILGPTSVVVDTSSPYTVTGNAAVGSTLTVTLRPNYVAAAYQWTRDGSAISGATSSTYQTVQADATHAVTCAISNMTWYLAPAINVVSSVVAPVITAQPVAVAVAVGATATFSVTATTGGGTLSYQWRKAGVGISGATSASYTTPATVAGDTGVAYSVVVTNAAGSVISNNAVLTVNAGNITASTYDTSTGKILQSRVEDGVTYTYTYPDSTHIVKTGGGVTETTTFNSAGSRLTSIRSAGTPNITASTYDGTGKILQSRVIDGVTYNYTYPDSTHVIRTGSNGITETIVTNAAGNIVTDTYSSGTGNVTATTYDGAGRLTAYTLDGVNHVVTYPDVTTMIDTAAGGTKVTSTYNYARMLVTRIAS